jgi:hypothetical protein
LPLCQREILQRLFGWVTCRKETKNTPLLQQAYETRNAIEEIDKRNKTDDEAGSTHQRSAPEHHDSEHSRIFSEGNIGSKLAIKLLEAVRFTTEVGGVSAMGKTG